jgi:hypothetical protein
VVAAANFIIWATTSLDVARNFTPSFNASKHLISFPMHQFADARFAVGRPFFLLEQRRAARLRVFLEA